MPERRIESTEPCGCIRYHWTMNVLSNWELCEFHATQLEQLRKHFGEPVLPLHNFCETIKLWFKAIERNNVDPDLGAPPEELRNEHLARGLWNSAPQQKEGVGIWQHPAKHWDKLTDLEKAPYIRQAGWLARNGWIGGEGWGPHGSGYYSVLNRISLDIQKSNLLGRLFHDQQQLRTRMCPLHKGHWEGQAMLSGCEHGCHGTGWLPEPGDDRTYAGGIMLVRLSKEPGPDGIRTVTEVLGPPDQARKLDND